MKTQAEKTLEKLMACYYDEKTNSGSTVPFAGTLTDAEIRALWIAAAKHLKGRGK
ncbi:hypothetical protein PROAA_610067 [Candidatus Propionivibrio aalborgensis]|uniref:Uncharacterized protein n=1 Tax=Candidatus Propionivibrio aalborgensis TaxID=1860101 RepID=A0A1A8Y114_9RHOO|nr:hypothetical protein [Candidatus Propionivibrio aalborgensis]SBT10707.1 hypothetical protein PROAA_610067 [Candidatus Propionivibrio aalborgensis]